MSMKLITTTTLGSSTTSITVNSIPSGYKSLLAFCALKGDNTSGGRMAMKFYFNSDTTDANYNFGIWYLEDNAMGGGAYTDRIIASTSSNEEANLWSASELFIPLYDNSTNYKSLFYHNGNPRAAASGYSLWQTTGLWKSNSAVTALTFTSVTHNFMAGSRIALYGIE